jgi:bifunctional non-homologous end joining protein LigD
MMAAAGPLPAGPGWAFEFKYDGVRAVTYLADDAVQIFSRNGNDITGSYPEPGELAGLLGGRSAIVDGEIIAPADEDRPSFARLQSRMHVAEPSAALLRTVPVRYYAFDLLELDGNSLLDRPYEKRREILRGLDLAGETVRVPSSFTEVHGPAVLHAAELAGFEGVVAKRLSAPYRPGKRSADWNEGAADPHPGGAGHRVRGGGESAVGHGGCAAAGHSGRPADPIRRAGGHRLHRRDARPPPRPPRSAAPSDVAGHRRAA